MVKSREGVKVNVNIYERCMYACKRGNKDQRKILFSEEMDKKGENEDVCSGSGGVVAC